MSLHDNLQIYPRQIKSSNPTQLHIAYNRINQNTKKEGHNPVPKSVIMKMFNYSLSFDQKILKAIYSFPNENSRSVLNSKP